MFLYRLAAKVYACATFLAATSRPSPPFPLPQDPSPSNSGRKWVLAAATRALRLPVLREYKFQMANKELMSICLQYIFGRGKLTRFISTVLGTFEFGKLKYAMELLIVRD